MSEAPSEGRARADSAEVAFRKIFIGGLSFSTDEDKLRKYFKQFGTVQDAVVMKDPVSKRSRGFGFVTYTDIAGVDCALSGDAHTIDSRKVEAKRAVPRSEMSRDQNPGNGSQKSAPVTPNGSSSQASTVKSSNNSSSTNNNNSTTTATTKSTTSSTGSAVPVNTTSNTGSGSSQSDSTKHGSSDARINLEDYAYNKIFVGGLHYDTRDAEFRTYFEKYGRVISAEVMFNRETHKSRGFGFIVFDNEQSAINVCDGKEHSIDGKVVEVKRAIPRSRLPAGTPTSSITPSMYKAALAPLPMPTTTTSSATTGRSGSGGPSKPRPAQSSVSAGTASGASTTTAAAAVAASHAPIISSRTVSSTSYAAALKGGTAQKSAGTATAKNINVPPPPPVTPTTTTTTTGVSRDHTAAAPHISNSGMNFQSLMYSSGLGSVQRPARSYSEPIVKFEGSFEGCSALNGDILPGGMNRNAGAGAIIKTPSSSRSNSIVQTPGGSLLNNDYSENGGGNNTSVSLGNLPWLSSPPTNSLDAAGVDFGLSLPPTTEQKSLTTGSDNAPAGLRAGPPGISNPWFPNAQTTTGLNDTKSQQPTQQQQQSQQQQSSFQQQSPFMGGPFGGMMYMPGPFMGVPPPPGVTPSPEHWAAMVSSHAIHEQQQMGMGPPPGQFPGQPFMMQQYPFFPPDGVFGPGTTPQQQQMMFFNAQQQMQANFQQMQQLQYQNQQQALALAAAQAQMQAAMGNSNNSSANQKGDSQAGNSGSEQQKTLTAGGSNTFPTTIAATDASNNSITGVAAVAGTVKASESSESDDLFQFHELNLNSPAFEPNAAQSWMPAANRR